MILGDLPVWICGFCYANELEYVKEIPGQKFGNDENDEYRFVKSVSKLHSSDEDWLKLIEDI